MIALGKAVGAVGQGTQGAEITAEYQPQKLQHQEQRGGDDLQLFDKLLPQPVLRRHRVHASLQFSIRDAARHHIGGSVFEQLDIQQRGEPDRSADLRRAVLRGQRAPAAIGPRQTLDLQPQYLLFQQLLDRRIVTDQRLIRHRWRQILQYLVDVAVQPRLGFSGPLMQQQSGLQ